jgi:hypothetical protein
MKLTSTQVERTLSQFEAQAIPDNHPVVPQLNELFGDHTFFIDPHGLSIVEPADDTPESAQAQVVNVAKWTDESRTRLTAQEPEPTPVTVSLTAN